jgi:alanine racemase
MYSTWTEIDTNAIQNNIRIIKDHTGTEVMAIVKANAYGHGAVPVAFAAQAGGASWFGVARASEALELRQAGITAPILLLGYTPEEHYREMIQQDVSLTVWDPDQILLLSDAAAAMGKSAQIQINVDTGMSRLGVHTEGALALVQQAATTSGIDYQGIYSHFAKADERDPGPTDQQWERFQALLKELEEAGLNPPLVHQANSAASLTRSETALSLVRVGIAMYGLHPSPECQLPAGFRPALSWKSLLSQVKVLPPGRGVSYGHEYVTTGEERIGTIPVGYADGYHRLPGNQVLVGGKRVPVIGRVTMDYILVQLDEVPDAAAGDEVVLIGRQGENEITADEVAAIWGTINYEVTCAINPSVPRLYP